MSVEDKISDIEEEIRKTPYNKATQHHIGKLKAKLAKLRERQQRGSGSRGGPGGYGFRKSGDATVVLAGFPSVGKSTLLNALTNANSEIGAYDFTTVNVIPGALEYKGAKIQILDVPGLISGASEGRGRGREVLSVVRSADLIIMLIDVFNLHQLDVIEKELYIAGLRLNKSPPKVRIKKKDRGGMEINSTVDLSLDDATIKAVLNEYRIHNAEVVIREDITVDQLIDVAIGNRVYVPALVVLNKIDLVTDDYLGEVSKSLKDFVSISADKELNVENLKDAIFGLLDFIRIFMKPQGQEADLEDPLVVLSGSTVRDVCNSLHKDFTRKFRFARVWGGSAKFEGQKVGITHALKDGDILSIVMEK